MGTAANEVKHRIIVAIALATVILGAIGAIKERRLRCKQIPGVALFVLNMEGCK